jgi:MYXO-CTERM domain-containing protein
MRFHRFMLLLIFAAMGSGAVPCGSARAAVITGVDFSSIPLSNPDSVFDASHTGNQYSLGAGTVFNPAGYDIRDLFGGQFDSYAPERGRVVFADEQPIGTVETVNVTLANPVALQSFDYWFSEDAGTGGARSTREFKLFAGTTLLDDVVVLNNTGQQSLTAVYGNNNVQISDTFLNAPVTANYTLEIVQNQNGSGDSGLRAIEFEAFVPEPAGLALMALAMLGACRRRRVFAAGYRPHE